MRKRANVTSDALVPAAKVPQARNEMRIRQKAHVEHQVRVGRNTIAKSEADNGNQQWPAAGILKSVNDELAQLVNVELRGVNDDVGEATDRAPCRWRSNRIPWAIESVLAQRMRTARFAEATKQDFVARFDKYQGRGMFSRELAVDTGELFDLLAFAGVHQQRGALNLAAAFDVEFAEGGD